MQNPVQWSYFKCHMSHLTNVTYYKYQVNHFTRDNMSQVSLFLHFTCNVILKMSCVTFHKCDMSPILILKQLSKCPMYCIFLVKCVQNTVQS